MLHKDGSKKFDNIVSKWKQTKDKDIAYISPNDVSTRKVDIRKFDIYDIFKYYIEKQINLDDIEKIINNIKTAIKIYEEKPKPNKKIINNSNKTLKGVELIRLLINDGNLRMIGEYYAKPLNTDLSWMNDDEGYKEIAEEAGRKFMKNRNQNKVKLIKNFITKINNGTVNNKNKAANEFRELKQKVNDQVLKQDLVKYLEKYLFGENLERTFAPPDHTDEADDFLKYVEEQEKYRVRFSDDYDSSGSGSNKKRKRIKNTN